MKRFIFCNLCTLILLAQTGCKTIHRTEEKSFGGNWVQSNPLVITDSILGLIARHENADSQISIAECNIFPVQFRRSDYENVRLQHIYPHLFVYTNKIPVHTNKRPFAWVSLYAAMSSFLALGFGMAWGWYLVADALLIVLTILLLIRGYDQIRHKNKRGRTLLKLSIFFLALNVIFVFETLFPGTFLAGLAILFLVLLVIAILAFIISAIIESNTRRKKRGS